MLGPPPVIHAQPPRTRYALTETYHLEHTQQWLPALEQWSALRDAASADIRTSAILGQARTLRQLNEEFLAEQTLRGAFLYDPSPLVRERAFAELAQAYAAVGDQDGLLTMVSMKTVRQADPATLRQLAELLLDQGQPDLALTISLALPPVERPLSVVARAAYQLGWWRVFDQNLTLWSDPAQRHLWEGYRAQQRGDYPEALQSWRQAGADGVLLADALETGLAIRQRLREAETAVREQAIVEWTQWQTRHPGVHVWRNADPLFSDYAGTTALYASGRDLFSQTYRAQPDRPVIVTVYGPAKLRFEGRLLYANASADQPPVDDWLVLRDGLNEEQEPINSDRPSQELSLVGDATSKPGRQTVLDYVVGPGLHTITVAARQRPLLVQASIWRPEIPLLVLPELTPASVAAAALNLGRGAPERRHPRAWDHGLPFGRYDLWRDDPAPEAPPAENAGLPLAIIAGCQRIPQSLPDFSSALPKPAVQMALLTRLGALNPPDLHWPVPPPDPAQQLRQRLINLLWEVEQAPDTLAQRLPEAEQLVAAQPGTPGIEPLLRRLRQRADWEPVLTVARSAGVRYIETPGWQPESPFLRARKALTPPVADDEQLLAGAEQLGLLAINPTATRLHLDLQAADVRYSPPQSLSAWYRLDDQPMQSLTLTPNAPARSLALVIPAGQHLLRIGITGPVANQYLKVRISQRAGKVNRSIVRDLRRLYQIATAQEPLQLPLMGPVWVRIDELRDGQIDSSYQYLGPGLQTLQLQPAKGRSEGLYRLHIQRITDTPQEILPTRVARLIPETLPAAPVQIPAASPPSKWVIQDRYALGEQQAGTWSLGAAFASSMASSDEPESQGVTDTYLEALASYRYYDPWRRNHYQADILTRWHRLGAPTFGLDGYWRHETEWTGVAFQLSWEAYAQRSEDWAWNSTVRGRIWQTRPIDPKTRHQPAVGFFYRDLHQSADYDYRPGYVDQDVLSEYKYFHRRGLVLADTLTHRPWLDTLWYASAALTSDEDGNFFTPEHASVTAGWKQLLGDWQVEASYRWSYYFAQGEHDWNRPAAYDRCHLDGSALWDHTWGGAGRLQLELSLQYSVDDQNLGAWLRLHWFPDRGRGYRDFRPGAVDFRDLRERRLPLEFNNRMDPPPGEVWTP